MQRKTRTFSPGDRVAIEISFACEGNGEIESVEAVFVREGSGQEIVFLGDAKEEVSGGGRATRYAARLEAGIDPAAVPGEYRCARLSARDRLDDDWDFADVATLDLVVHVERIPRRLEVTASRFL
jgi:hypothetical protein